MPSQPLYVSEREVARLLGRAIDWLKSHRTDLEDRYGFPKVDQAIGKTHRESIEEWARKRNAKSLASSSERLSETNQQENLNAL